MKRDLPLYNVLKERNDAGTIRFHMPGHKGKPIPASVLSTSCAIDFTELYGTGNLYDGVYPIFDAEDRCASAWGCENAFFLTGGATMGIHTMLSLVRMRTGKVLVDRGSHKSVYNALGLLDLEPVYIYPEFDKKHGIATAYTTDAVSAALEKDEEIGAFILTSPTYYGICTDIEKIAEVCHERGVLLLVDEAHGAHFPFISGKGSAVSRGADLAVCSLHKTLPALGQAALLTAGKTFRDYEIRQKMSIFGTSSPSYQIMASIDLARDYMENEGREVCKKHIEKIHEIRDIINKRGIFTALDFPDGDPLRLCVMTSGAGISGYVAARILEDEYKVVCEMADERQVLFIITPADTEEELDILLNSIIALEERRGEAISAETVSHKAPCVKLSPHEVMKRECERIMLKNAGGRIAAANISPYPPGIPVIAMGEVIEDEFLPYLYHNGFDDEDLILVIKEDT
ncbi:MAG: aminotransferase class I/II-fold pyridoxal phosphate-dependent enzyme [Clostridia bacterium]|nr:aminotransferase class I/II-fold pyridoxal phosphate-dependent enzyme [Clostridia bacterium]